MKRWHAQLFAGVVVFLLVYGLGWAVLFEPDEGRNAEKAREILVLDNWITPHENFVPVLDKPIAYYWLVASSMKIFGQTEWAARFPSALAALLCALMVFRFTDKQNGRWAALWSTAMLVTSLEFFIYARLVIFDMTLTALIAASMFGFYRAIHSDDTRTRWFYCIILYGALAAGTLVKGLIAVIFPGMVFFTYLLITKNWRRLLTIHLVPGAILFLTIVVPWYGLAEIETPGYLRYFLWEEHFGRFATDEFERGEPWYFFIGVVVVGFLPWSILLPWAIKDLWRKKFDDWTLYLILWAVLPFVFFSLSKAKLPHYILPIFPALAILTARYALSQFEIGKDRLRTQFFAVWLVHSSAMLYLIVGTTWPQILPHQIRVAVDHLSYFLWGYGVILVLLMASFFKAPIATWWSQLPRSFLLNFGMACLFIVYATHMKAKISHDRSAYDVAKVIRAGFDGRPQIAIFRTTLAGLPFYLQSQRPLWMVTHGKKQRTILGNFYNITDTPPPETKWGKTLLLYEEFAAKFNRQDESIAVVVKQKNLDEFRELIGEPKAILAHVDEYVVVSN